MHNSKFARCSIIKLTNYFYRLSTQQHISSFTISTDIRFPCKSTLFTFTNLCSWLWKLCSLKYKQNIRSLYVLLCRLQLNICILGMHNALWKYWYKCGTCQRRTQNVESEITNVPSLRHTLYNRRVHLNM